MDDSVVLGVDAVGRDILSDEREVIPAGEVPQEFSQCAERLSPVFRSAESSTRIAYAERDAEQLQGLPAAPSVANPGLRQRLEAHGRRGPNTWIAVIDWLNDFFRPLGDEYAAIFTDCNPSFAIYTQIALASVEKLVRPVMADDRSRRAVQNALSLAYGLRLPSEIYATYALNTKLEQAGRSCRKSI